MEVALPVGRTPSIGDSRRRAWLTQLSDVSKRRNENSLFQNSSSNPVCVQLVVHRSLNRLTGKLSPEEKSATGLHARN